MWYIILYYIVVTHSHPVSPNAFPFRSVMDMSNMYRTNMMQPVRLGQPPPQPAQLLPRQRPLCGPIPFPGCEQPTTCVENRQLSALHNNYQRVCYTIRRWPDAVQQMVSTSQGQRFSPMMPPVLRQMPPQAKITTRMIAPQPRSPAPIIPQMVVSQTGQQSRNVFKQSNNYLKRNVYHQNMTMATRLGSQTHKPPPPVTPRQLHHISPQVRQQSYFYPRVEHEYPILMPLNDEGAKVVETTSTAASTAPPNNQRPGNSLDPVDPADPNAVVSTTSTMPPYPGGVKPDSDDNDEPFLLCAGGKAKCNKYLWTTKKKNRSKKTTKALLLWTI